MSGVDGGGLSAEEREKGRASWHHRCTCGIAEGWLLTVEHDADCPFQQMLAAQMAAAQRRGAERVTAVEAVLDEHEPRGYLVDGPVVIRAVRAALADPAPREYDDGGPRVREAVERAERDAEAAARALREAADAVPRAPGDQASVRGWLRDRADALEGGEDRG